MSGSRWEILTDGIKHHTHKERLWWWLSKLIVAAVAILFIGILSYGINAAGGIGPIDIGCSIDKYQTV